MATRYRGWLWVPTSFQNKTYNVLIHAQSTLCRSHSFRYKEKTAKKWRNKALLRYHWRIMYRYNIFFPGPLAFCKEAVERVNSVKNILNSSVEKSVWTGMVFFRKSHMYVHHQIRLNELINMMYFIF